MRLIACVRVYCTRSKALWRRQGAASVLPAAPDGASAPNVATLGRRALVAGTTMTTLTVRTIAAQVEGALQEAYGSEPQVSLLLRNVLFGI